MWFGTQNGLVKYDGYNMKVYQPDPDDSLSISNGQIWAIYEDRAGTLWIGTEHEGLNHFNRATETFTRYRLNPDDSTGVYPIGGICEDSSGDLLLGNGIKLILFHPQDKSSKDIYTEDSIIARDVRAIVKDRLTGNIFAAVTDKIMIYDPEKKMLIKDNDIDPKSELGKINYASLYQAADGTIWIGHSKGLAKFSPLTNAIKYYQPVPSANYKVENDINVSLADKNGLIWGGGSWKSANFLGLVCFDPKREQFKFYHPNPENKSSLSTNSVWSVYEDHSGVLWVGTGHTGLNKWDKSKDQFKRYSYDSDGKRFNTVYTILEDKEGIIWFGTDNGLYSFDCHLNEFRNYRYDAESKINKVLYMSMDESGIIWFATRTKGLGRFNRENGSFQFYLNNPNDPMSPGLHFITYILPEGKDVLWVGTYGSGLYRFDKKTGKFNRFIHDPDNSRSLSNDQITFVYNDKRGNLWIGTNLGGLNLFDRVHKSFKFFYIGEYKNTSITAIYEDHKTNFWVGNYQTGLYLFDRNKGSPEYNISVKDGLSNSQISSILEDDSGNLWMGTEYGLSDFDPETKNIKNYFSQVSFDANKYRARCACKLSTGQMLFGTMDGFIMFHPDSIKDDPIPPQVVISNVSLFNRTDGKLKIDGFISEMKELDLSYNENDLRFDYVGLQFADPSKNRYKYKLEGFDKEWVDAGTQRNATYTNLDAGEYVFRVTACNADGVWNEKGASLKIIIPPPFWATWWAYSFYVLFFLGLLYSIRRYELNRTQLKNQVKLDEVKLKEREETDKMKSRFFANISHEFRTPLTLILGPVESIFADTSEEETKKKAGTIKRNANRLVGLINQLLDLSKLEAGRLELKASKDNIVSFIKGITMSFESFAEGKDITLKVIPERERIELYFDKEKMTKIMTNLLSNAFKFTPEGGQITVSVDESDKNSIIIRVKDTGIGIPEEELPKLFDRFYQVDSSQTREHEGTGIGLALTKELVELHQGSISADSKPGEWTEFTIEFPPGRKHLKDEEIVERETNETDILKDLKNFPESNVADTSPFDELKVTDNGNNVNGDKNIILVVEDNTDVREFIKDSLGNEFQIEEASNGDQGVRKAEHIIPDLIISDIMMPKMDGNELTESLKKNEMTSHIPIILLTAKSEQHSRLEGLETGADDYLTKPFDAKELKIRIKNLISIRRKLQEKYGRGDYAPKKKVEEKKLSNLEEQFMHKVMEVIEKHLAEEEFTIEQFGTEAGMSRVQLHRKLKALTGKSASNYLRAVRLSKAREMIREGGGNISEIAYSVGFSSPAYFTRCFREEYGYPPSDLLQ